MPQNGRPPVPLERETKLGHLREDKIPGRQLIEIVRPEGSLEPPSGLGPEGLAFWDRVTVAAHWLWPQLDESLLIMTAEAFDERAQLRQHLPDNPEDWRSRLALRHLEKQMLHHLSALGLTLSDRAKLGLIEAKTGGKLEALMAKRAAMGAEW